MAKIKLGRVPCATHSVRDFVDEIRELLLHRELFPRTLLCINAHIYNLAVGDPALLACLDSARVTAADGMGIVWAARLLGHRLPERCNMTEAYHSFLVEERMPPSRAVLIGCSEAEARAAASTANQVSSHCRIAHAYSGFLPEAEYEAALAGHSDSDLILLGMGTPKTELVAQTVSRMCPRAVVWGIGGGTIRIDAGTLAEAPVSWRRMGLQWLYRLGREPHSLARRYLIGNPLFVTRVFRTLLAERTSRDMRAR